MKAGDMVRVVEIPAGMRDEDDLRTKTLFELCLGQSFPITELEHGFIKLDIGEVMGEPAYANNLDRAGVRRAARDSELRG